MRERYMIKIAICDDEVYFRRLVKKYITNYLSKQDILFDIAEFGSGKELLQCGIEIVQYTAIFLDINMQEVDGIATARKIREYSREVLLVFVTADINYSLEGYKVDAMRYLLKNDLDFEESIYECMEAILSKMNYESSKKWFQFLECKKEVLLDRILYIESKLHKLQFYIMEKKLVVYTQYGTLNELEQELQGGCFVRIHQSFLVNLKHVENVADGMVTLSNQKRLNVPRARYREVRNVFEAYKKEQ